MSGLMEYYIVVEYNKSKETNEGYMNKVKYEALKSLVNKIYESGDIRETSDYSLEKNIHFKKFTVYVQGQE